MTSKKSSAQTYIDIINKWGVVAIITPDESKILENSKLSDNMPENWDGKDLFARYRKVELYKELVFD